MLGAAATLLLFAGGQVAHAARLWPFQNTQGPHRITALVGDYRSSLRFHAGVDMNPAGVFGDAAIGTPVFHRGPAAVPQVFQTGDIVETVRIGDVAYTHIAVDPSIIANPLVPVQNNQQVGTIKYIGPNLLAHLHFTVYGELDNFLNALAPVGGGGFVNLVDSHAPEVFTSPFDTQSQAPPYSDPMLFYANPGNTGQAPFQPLAGDAAQSPVIHGKVDILMRARDKVNTDNVGAPFKSGYAIRNLAGKFQFPTDYPIQFTVLDRVVGAPTQAPVYSVSSALIYNTALPFISASDTFFFWVTNRGSSCPRVGKNSMRNWLSSTGIWLF